MAFSPISHTVPQYHSNGSPASSFVLKAYSSGTLTNISMATDSTGNTTAATITLNAQGYPAVSGTVVIPYINEKYKLALYATQAAADADTSPIWIPDTIPISGDFLSVTQSISTTTSLDSSDDGNHIIATGTITITLPDVDSVGTGFVVTVRNGGTGLVTIDGDGAETINGATTLVFFPGDSCIFTSSSTETDQWSTIGLEELRGVKAETGTTYTFVSGDHDKLVTTSNASAIAGTLPQAGAAFPDGWYTTVSNVGAGTLTITPTTSTIDGVATLVLTSGKSVVINSNGTNYFSSLSSPMGGDLIETQTASVSATFDFKTGIDSTSATYVLVVEDVLTHVDSDNFLLRTSTDGGSTFDSGAGNYEYGAVISQAGGAPSGSGSTAATSINLMPSLNTGLSVISGRIYIHSPAGTNRTQIDHKLTLYNQSDNVQRFVTGHGMRDSQADVDAVQILLNSDTITSGRVSLYRIKHA